MTWLIGPTDLEGIPYFFIRTHACGHHRRENLLLWKHIIFLLFRVSNMYGCNSLRPLLNPSFFSSPSSLLNPQFQDAGA